MSRFRDETGQLTSFDERRVLGQLDDVWQTAREVEAGLPYMRHTDFLRHMATLRRLGFATCRRSDAHGRWEYAISKVGDAALVKEGVR